ncbi:MAG TPA: hypothetical protein VLZ50_09180 [Terracidiphilus sp.]|nr:hypothetical protein [Terracidiphilus sp.]
MFRWLKWAVLALTIGFVLAYACDWAIYRLRGSPSSKVTVNSYQTVPLKGHKYEYDYLGSDDEPCSLSLFPQGGQNPCWWLRRHRNQVTNL